MKHGCENCKSWVSSDGRKGFQYIRYRDVRREGNVSYIPGGAFNVTVKSNSTWLVVRSSELEVNGRFVVAVKLLDCFLMHLSSCVDPSWKGD
jgi:hypothetical protein